MIPIDRFEQGQSGLTQDTLRLEEVRAELRPAWHDAAAHDINGRFLDPLQEDAARLLTRIREQIERLKIVQEKLAQARDLGLAAGRANALTDECLRRADTEMRDAERLEGVFRGLEWSVRNVLMKQIVAAIQQANAHQSTR